MLYRDDSEFCSRTDFFDESVNFAILHKRLENNNNNRNHSHRRRRMQISERQQKRCDVEMACNNSRNRIKEEEPQILNTMFSVSFPLAKKKKLGQSRD